MIYGGSITQRGIGIVNGITKLAESLGLLNKGSAKAAAPTASDTATVQPVTSNSLNVTRVGGVSTLIGAAGGAALLIYNVNKTKDRASIVVAAYAGIGVIVAAALLTVAIIIAADIRARASIAAAVSPVPPAKAQVKRLVAEAAQAPAHGNPPGFTASLDQAYNYVIINAAEADMLLTLPDAKSSSWQQMTIKREDNNGGRTVAIHPQGQQTVIGQQVYDLPAANPIQIYSNGENWLRVD